MANKKLLLGAALAATVLLILFLFTKDGQKSVRQLQHMPPAAATADQKAADAKKATKQQAKKPGQRKAMKRKRMLERWAKMTPEQRKEFMKTHPNFKPPAETKPATGAAKSAATQPAKTQ